MSRSSSARVHVPLRPRTESVRPPSGQSAGRDQSGGCRWDAARPFRARSGEGASVTPRARRRAMRRARSPPRSISTKPVTANTIGPRRPFEPESEPDERHERDGAVSGRVVRRAEQDPDRAEHRPARAAEARRRAGRRASLRSRSAPTRSRRRAGSRRGCRRSSARRRRAARRRTGAGCPRRGSPRPPGRRSRRGTSRSQTSCRRPTGGR